MKILIDGDAFPNIKEVVELAERFEIKVSIYCDYSHNMDNVSKNSLIKYVSTSSNSADIELINDTFKDDLVLTGDYGVATMAISKKAICLNQNGYFYKDNNIDYLLEIKNINLKRRSHYNLKGPKKRIKQDTERLIFNIEKVLRGEYSNEKEN